MSHCKYNLRGLDSNRCPECGMLFRIVPVDRDRYQLVFAGMRLLAAAIVLLAACIEYLGDPRRTGSSFS